MRARPKCHVRLDADNDSGFVQFVPRSGNDKTADVRRLPVLFPFGEPILVLYFNGLQSNYRIGWKAVDFQSFI